MWHVVADGALHVHTGDQTGKAKRLKVNGRAELVPSNARRRIVGDTVRVSGTLLNGEDPQRLDVAFKDKYGMQRRAVRPTSAMRRNKIEEPAYFRFAIDSDSSVHDGSEPQEPEQETRAEENLDLKWWA